MNISYNTDAAIANFIEKTRDYSTDTLLEYMGFISRVLILCGYISGFLVKEKNGKHRIDARNTTAFLLIDELSCPYEWIGEQVNNNWVHKKVAAVQKSAQRFFKRLQDFSLWGHLENDGKYHKKIVNGKSEPWRSPTRHVGFSVPVLLLLYQALEAEFIRRKGREELEKRKPATPLDGLDFVGLAGYTENPPEDAVLEESDEQFILRTGFAALPKHKGALVPLMFEAAFGRKMNCMIDGFETPSRADLSAAEWVGDRIVERLEGVLARILLAGGLRSLFDGTVALLRVCPAWKLKTC